MFRSPRRRSQASSSVEFSPGATPGVTTEFQWDVANLRELFSGHFSISSPYFEVEGTAQKGLGWSPGLPLTKRNTCLEIRKDVRRECYDYIVINVDYHCKWATQITVKCGEERVRSPVHRSTGMEREGAKVEIKGTQLERAMLSMDALRVTVQIQTLEDKQRSDTAIETAEPARSPVPSLGSNLGAALQSDELLEISDVELVSSGGATFPAHRQLLALRSPVFHRMFYGGMREALSHRATIPASDAALSELLHCVYSDELRDEAGLEPIAAELLDLGHQYEVPRLVALAEAGLLRTLSVANAAERLRIGLRYPVAELKDACLALVKGNLGQVMCGDGWAGLAQDPQMMALLINEQGNREASPERGPVADVGDDADSGGNGGAGGKNRQQQQRRLARKKEEP